MALLDYDDLLLYWQLLVSEPRLAKHVGRHFDHILVDEYQDTNALQAKILRAIKPDGYGLTVVGDDAQAIYSFRAAEVENILGFAAAVHAARRGRAAGAELPFHAAGARRGQRIAGRGARGSSANTCWQRGTGGTQPRYVSIDDLESQAEYVARQVLQRREAGVSLRRQAVLFRTGSHSDLLEMELTRRRIPFVKYGGLQFLEGSHVKDLIAVLRWADNPRNTLAAFRVLQLLPGNGSGQCALDAGCAGRGGRWVRGPCAV